MSYSGKVVSTTQERTSFLWTTCTTSNSFNGATSIVEPSLPITLRPSPTHPNNAIFSKMREHFHFQNSLPFAFAPSIGSLQPISTVTDKGTPVAKRNG